MVIYFTHVQGCCTSKTWLLHMQVGTKAAHGDTYTTGMLHKLHMLLHMQHLVATHATHHGW